MELIDWSICCQKIEPMLQPPMTYSTAMARRAGLELCQLIMLPKSSLVSQPAPLFLAQAFHTFFPVGTAHVLAFQIPSRTYRSLEREECTKTEPRSATLNMWKFQTNGPKRMHRSGRHAEETLVLATLTNHAGVAPRGRTISCVSGYVDA
ncbi:MAG: hypothetical protein Q7T25_13790 [Sideroxyarcus sp.]|nr:hypothetical protein [Sideroxyarcus sp.]